MRDEFNSQDKCRSTQFLDHSTTGGLELFIETVRGYRKDEGSKKYKFALDFTGHKASDIKIVIDDNKAVITSKKFLANAKGKEIVEATLPDGVDADELKDQMRKLQIDYDLMNVEKEKKTKK